MDTIDTKGNNVVVEDDGKGMTATDINDSFARNAKIKCI